jgi:hypothetical protein
MNRLQILQNAASLGADESRNYAVVHDGETVASHYDQINNEIVDVEHLWTNREQELLDAVRAQNLARIIQIAKSGQVFNHDIETNNAMLKELGLTNNANLLNYPDETNAMLVVLKALPGDRERFTISVLLNLFEYYEIQERIRLLQERWLKLNPGIFKLDNDLFALDKYARFLAESQIDKAELLEEAKKRENNNPDSLAFALEHMALAEEEQNVIKIEPLIDLIREIYKRQKMPHFRAASVINAFMRPIEMEDNFVGGSTKVRTIRSKIERAQRAIEAESAANRAVPQLAQSSLKGMQNDRRLERQQQRAIRRLEINPF